VNINYGAAIDLSPIIHFLKLGATLYTRLQKTRKKKKSNERMGHSAHLRNAHAQKLTDCKKCRSV